ncbi:Outer membrane lipoprotein SmpA, a component of the essential YaeT outer-membrane protein assembly complex [hydrothermal vent metagenome]|uniref:Outer membrane lipoprotein SmpA, a component of the essential YaeT outer-membrane protein assembly complex n=1 Tax=hydrothermal vent metagenome TaxID=652676 RepID=A0A1W1BQD6_9ZZZZ
MKKIIIVLSVLSLFSCLPKAYHPDINQGNEFTLKQVNSLQKGMTKAQVKEILGTPAIIDVFHNTRWDYINNSKLSDGRIIKAHLVLLFNEQDLLETIKKENISQLKNKPKKSKKSIKSENKEEKSWYQFW